MRVEAVRLEGTKIKTAWYLAQRGAWTLHKHVNAMLDKTVRELHGCGLPGY